MSVRGFLRGSWALAVVAGLAATTAQAAPRKPGFTLSSPDLPAGRSFADAQIGSDFGCTGKGLSPELVWRRAPKGTKSFAVLMHDAYNPPRSGWWHWAVYDVPANVSHLAQGAGGAVATLPAGSKMGLPDGDPPERRYYGPCPDQGDPPHPYTITVYALDVDHLAATEAATPAALEYAMVGHILAKSSLKRTFARPKAP